MGAAADGSGAVGTAPVPVSAVALLTAFPFAGVFLLDFPSPFPFGSAAEVDGATAGDVFGSVCSADEEVAAAVVVVVVSVAVVVVAVVSVKRLFRTSALSASVKPSCCLVRTMEESRTGRSDVDGSGSPTRSFQTSEAGSS